MVINLSRASAVAGLVVSLLGLGAAAQASPGLNLEVSTRRAMEGSTVVTTASADPGGQCGSVRFAAAFDASGVAFFDETVASSGGSYETSFEVPSAPSGTEFVSVRATCEHDDSVTDEEWVRVSGTGINTVTPTRVLDTRTGIGVSAPGPVGPGGDITLTLPDLAELENDPAGVVLNVTSTDSTAASYVTVWAQGTRPPTSSLNTEPGTDVANAVWTPVGPGNAVRLYNNAGSTHLVADLLAVIADTSDVELLQPARILDTRTASGVGPDPIGPGEHIEVQVAGRGGVPFMAPGPASLSPGIVVLNLTATRSDAPSFLTVWGGGDRPPTSDLNTEPGTDVAKLVAVQLSADGKFSIYNNAGTTHVVADVVGYALDVSADLLPTPRTRLLDTRNAIPPSGPLGPRADIVVTIPQGIQLPANSSAAVLNVTATNATAPSFVTAYSNETRPPASNLNTEPGTDVANLVIVPISDERTVTLYNNAGTTHLIVDLVALAPDP